MSYRNRYPACSSPPPIPTSASPHRQASKQASIPPSPRHALACYMPISPSPIQRSNSNHNHNPNSNPNPTHKHNHNTSPCSLSLVQSSPSLLRFSNTITRHATPRHAAPNHKSPRPHRLHASHAFSVERREALGRLTGGEWSFAVLDHDIRYLGDRSFTVCDAVGGI
jgi:hypothetical protein